MKALVVAEVVMVRVAAGRVVVWEEPAVTVAAGAAAASSQGVEACSVAAVEGWAVALEASVVVARAAESE